MSDQLATRLSVSVVCYLTPASHLDALLTSLAVNLRELSRDGTLRQADIYVIDNSPTPVRPNESRSWDIHSNGSSMGHPLESSPPGDSRTWDTHSENAAWDTHPGHVLDARRQSLQALGATLHLLSGHGNLGYGAGHNLAIHRADADYHLMLNPDVELAPGCLSAGLSYLESHPEVVMASPRASNGSGEKQFLCKRYPSVGLFFLRGFVPRWLHAPFRRALARFEMQDLPEDRPSRGIPIVSGCFMLCRMAPLKAVGGFDACYFLYFEDFDLSLRLGRHGQIAYLPAMRIQHHGGNSARKGPRHISLFARSGRRFFATHGWRWL